MDQATGTITSYNSSYSDITTYFVAIWTPYATKTTEYTLDTVSTQGLRGGTFSFHLTVRLFRPPLRDGMGGFWGCGGGSAMMQSLVQLARVEIQVAHVLKSEGSLKDG